MENKHVFLFAEGNAQMRELLGGKGANLAEMTRIGLPVPQGFTVSTAACLEYLKRGDQTIWDELREEIMQAMQALEKISGKKIR